MSLFLCIFILSCMLASVLADVSTENICEYRNQITVTRRTLASSVSSLFHHISLLPFSICLLHHPHILHAFGVQSPTRAVLLKMAVQRRASDHHHPPRPGSACSLKRSPFTEAELTEVRPSSACAHPSALPNKWAEKVK